MGRWDNQDDELTKLLKEYHIVNRLELTDTYDQLLLDLKRLHAERAKVPENKRKPYDIVIQRVVDYIYYIAEHAHIPRGSVYEDLVATEKGGKYRNLYPVDYDNVVSPEEEYRKRKSTKPKPKRKVIKKCKCKK